MVSTPRTSTIQEEKQMQQDTLTMILSLLGFELSVYLLLSPFAYQNRKRTVMCFATLIISLGFVGLWEKRVGSASALHLSGITQPPSVPPGQLQAPTGAINFVCTPS